MMLTFCKKAFEYTVLIPLAAIVFIIGMLICAYKGSITI